MMNDSMLLSIGIAQLQHVFVKAQEWTEQQPLVKRLVTDIPNHFFDYTAIAFEAAAMQLATSALRNQEPLSNWSVLAEDAAHPYPISSYLGLGMALAQLRLDPSPYVAEAPVLWGSRIWAGYGYYNNYFRKRTEVDYMNEQSTEVKALYWQGIGRSYWHKSQGDVQVLKENLDGLEGERLKAAWRGIGIASTYLGIVGEPLWKALEAMAGPYKQQLAVGAILVSASIRSTSRNRCDELLLLLTGVDLEQAKVLHQKTIEASTKPDSETPFLDWITVIEQALVA
jgi:hypothetical protein